MIHQMSMRSDRALRDVIQDGRLMATGLHPVTPIWPHPLKQSYK